MIAGRKKDLTYEFDTRVVERESVAECTENGNKNEINKEVKGENTMNEAVKEAIRTGKQPSVLSLVPPESKRYW